jgi:hypothetical protein
VSWFDSGEEKQNCGNEDRDEDTDEDGDGDGSSKRTGIKKVWRVRENWLERLTSKNPNHFSTLTSSTSTHIELHRYVLVSHTASYHILRSIIGSTHRKTFLFDTLPQNSFPVAFIDYSSVSTNGLTEADRCLLLAFENMQNLSD